MTRRTARGGKDDDAELPRQARMRGLATGNSRVIQAGRDVNISEVPPEYVLVPLPAAPARLAPQEARRQPSRLLAARRQVVGFSGRRNELKDLASWRDRAERAAVRLISGPGGQGKTRLAEHFARLSAGVGWQVQVAYPASEVFAGMGGQEKPPAGKPGRLLVIVDYAERWALDRLLRLIADLESETSRSLRFLLMARSAGLWWYGLSHRLEDGLELSADAMPLPALAASAEERVVAFTRARDSFAAAMAVPDADALEPPAALSDDAYGVALTVHMAALAALDAHIRDGTPPADPGLLTAYLLGREQVYWEELHRHGGNGSAIETAVMRRVVFTASLTGPHTNAEGAGVVGQAGLSGDPALTQRLLDAHAVCYPPASPAAVLEPLHPDRLAEDFLALLTPGGPPHAYPPDPWALTGLRRLLLRDNEEDYPPYAKQALTVMIEAAVRWEHFATGQLYPLLRERPELVLAAGGAAMVTLAKLPHLDPMVLEAVEPLLPEQDVDLALGAAALAEPLTQHRLATTPDPVQQARLHLDLGVRQGIAGLGDQAISSLQQAVALLRDLPASQAEAARAGLASALQNLGTAQLHKGQYQAALTSLQEAVRHYERAIAAHPAGAGEGLAACLDLLGVALSHVGGNEEALRIQQLVVQSWQRHPRQDSVTSAQYARALLNLGNRLAGRAERLTGEAAKGAARDARAKTSEALRIFRRLAADDPGTYSPDLARALGNWADDLVAAGKKKEALRAATEAAALYSALAEANPAAFQIDYGKGLYNLGELLGAMHRFTEARDRIRQSLEQFRDGSDRAPGRNRAVVAAALARLAACQADLGELDDAVAVTREAIGLSRRLGRADSVSDRQRAARALGFLALRLGWREKWQQAAAAASAAAALSRSLVRADLSLAGEAERIAELSQILRAATRGPAARELVAEVFRELPPGLG